MYMSVCHYMPGDCEVRKGHGAVELELWIVMGHHDDAGNWILVIIIITVINITIIITIITLQEIKM